MKLDSSIIDTQILSEAFKAGKTIHRIPISSPTAKEFLLAQSRNGEKPQYYVLNPAFYANPVHMTIAQSEHFGNPKWAKLGDRRTDQITIDFRGEFQPYREYGDQALAISINEKYDNLFHLSISHLPKQTQRYLSIRWRFLIQNECKCLPVNEAIVVLGLSLFSSFVQSHCSASPEMAQSAS